MKLSQIVLGLAALLSVAALADESNSYKHLNELWAQSKTPETQKFAGWWSGRYFHVDSDRAYGIALVVRDHNDAGPLFAPQWDLCTSRAPFDAEPGYFDSGSITAWVNFTCPPASRSDATALTLSSNGTLENYQVVNYDNRSVTFLQQFREYDGYLLYRSFYCNEDKDCTTPFTAGYFFVPVQRH